MPGSPTTPGCPSACVGALGNIAFRYTDSVGCYSACNFGSDSHLMMVACDGCPCPERISLK